MAAASAWFNRQPIVCKTTALSVCSVADSFIASSLPYPAPQGEPPCRRIARAALPVAPTKGTTVPPSSPSKRHNRAPQWPQIAPPHCHTAAATPARRGAAPRPSKGEEANHAQKGTPVPLGCRSDAEGSTDRSPRTGSISGLHGNRLPDEPTRRFPPGRCKTRPATAREAPSASVFPSENGWMNSSS